MLWRGFLFDIQRVPAVWRVSLGLMRTSAQRHISRLQVLLPQLLHTRAGQAVAVLGHDYGCASVA